MRDHFSTHLARLERAIFPPGRACRLSQLSLNVHLYVAIHGGLQLGGAVLASLVGLRPAFRAGYAAAVILLAGLFYVAVGRVRAAARACCFMYLDEGAVAHAPQELAFHLLPEERHAPDDQLVARWGFVGGSVSAGRSWLTVTVHGDRVLRLRNEGLWRFVSLAELANTGQRGPTVTVINGQQVQLERSSDYCRLRAHGNCEVHIPAATWEDLCDWLTGRPSGLGGAKLLSVCLDSGDTARAAAQLEQALAGNGSRCEYRRCTITTRSMCEGVSIHASGAGSMNVARTRLAEIIRELRTAGGWTGDANHKEASCT